MIITDNTLTDQQRHDHFATLDGFRTRAYQCIAAAMHCFNSPTQSPAPTRESPTLPVCLSSPNNNVAMVASMTGSTPAESIPPSFVNVCQPLRFLRCAVPTAERGSCWPSTCRTGCARTRRRARTGPSAIRTYARGRGHADMIPGWPYSFVTALETGQSSWTAVLDARRLGPDDDATLFTACQLRAVTDALARAGHYRTGDADILIVADAGYDGPRLAWLLSDLPVIIISRVRSHRVYYGRAGKRAGPTKGRPPRHGSRLALREPDTHTTPCFVTASETPRWSRPGPRLSSDASETRIPWGMGEPSRAVPDHRGQSHRSPGRAVAR